MAPTGVPHAPLELERVTKRFGSSVALRDASLRVRPGTLHALLGENGAGKSTLVNVAFGHVRPDAGRVLVDGRPRVMSSPADAIAAGIGMVHQHFLLVPAMTVAENVALGRAGRLDLRRVAEEITAVGRATGLRIEPHAVVGTLDVAGQQRTEIVKALVRGARTLVLDEPTAVLAPSEAAELLAWVRRFVDAGHAAVLITHKLREALAYADDVTVLRRGAVVLSRRAADVGQPALVAAMLGTDTSSDPLRDPTGSVATTVGATAVEATPVEAAAAVAAAVGLDANEARAGTDAGSPPRSHDDAPRDGARHRSAAGDIEGARGLPPVVLRLEHVGVRDALGVDRLRDVSLLVRAGEVVGVAAVEGAGHHELLRVLAGRLRPTSGAASVPDHVGFIPEDRHRDALVLEMSLPENVALRDAGRRRGRIRWRDEAARARAIVTRHEVRAPAMEIPAAALSGGNQQKLVLGRELWGDPAALVAESPTRGLDVRASAAVLDELRLARTRGAAVVVYASDLDELLAIADRVVVVHAGRVHEVPRSRDAIGRAMVGAEAGAGTPS